MDDQPRPRRVPGIRHAHSRQTMSEQEDAHGRPRAHSQRTRADSPETFESRFPRFQRYEGPEHLDVSRTVSRDFAPASSPSRYLHTEFSLPPPSLRRRVGSSHLSVSPGPSRTGTSFYDGKKGLIAIAPISARDPDTVSRKFSLAGPGAVEALTANQNYIDPGYVQLNPAYDQPSNVRPVWSLAKPLPHVLRSGMVPEKDEIQRIKKKQRLQEEEESAEEHADLELGRIEPSLRPNKFTSQLSQLASLRRDRELNLFDTFQHLYEGTPGQSPAGASRRRLSHASTDGYDTVSHLRESAIEEEEDDEDAATDKGEEEEEPSSMEHHRLLGRQQPSENEFPQLREAIAHVKQVKEEEKEQVEPPYEDAVPLLAYHAEDDEVHNLHTYWSLIRLYFRDPFAEFLAVCVMDICGFSTNICVTISRGAWGTGDTANWVWGFACMMAIYVAGGVSGAQLNPATSFMLYVYRGFPLYKVLIYLPAQFLAIFLSSLMTFTLFKDGILEYAREEALKKGLAFNPASPDLPREIFSCFFSFPRHSWVTFKTAYLSEMLGTAVLTVTVLALGDDTNAPPGAGMSAMIVGLVVTAVSMALAYNTGLYMNPIRDLAPRLLFTIMDYGKRTAFEGPNLFSDGYWFKVSFLGPLTGVMLGAFFYDAFIFVGGESPVNYLSRRIRRAAGKWKKRWAARFAKRKRKAEVVKTNGGSRYGSL